MLDGVEIMVKVEISRIVFLFGLSFYSMYVRRLHLGGMAGSIGS